MKLERSLPSLVSVLSQINLICAHPFCRAGVAYSEQQLGYGSMYPGFKSPGTRHFSLLQKCPDHLQGLLSCKLRGNQGSFSGAKPLRGEVDHSCAYSARPMNEWSYISAPHVCQHGVDRDKFSFLPPILFSAL